MNALSKLGVCILSLVFSVSSYGSAIVQLDHGRSLITVKGEIIYYGPKASEEVAQKATTEIQTYWNGGTNAANASQYFTADMSGKKYQVIFEIRHRVLSEADALDLLDSNPSPEITFVKILRGNAAAGDRSYMTGLGSNEGVWYLSDNLGLSTTAPHEYGHGIGLDHPYEGDWRGRGQPAIMCPRGTFVDAIYQYDPKADAGAPGGTVSPYKRKVIQWDINNLRFSTLRYDASGKAALNIPRGESSLEMLHTVGRVY